jgi:hypothetical protein
MVKDVMFSGYGIKSLKAPVELLGTDTSSEDSEHFL